MAKIKHIKLKILIAVFTAVFLGIWLYFEIPCPVLTVLNLPCPGCGMTRAWLAALRLDFADAFRYHPMFWSVPVLGLYLIFDGRLFKNKRLNNAVLIFLAIGFAAAYIFRLSVPSQRALFQ